MFLPKIDLAFFPLKLSSKVLRGPMRAPASRPIGSLQFCREKHSTGPLFLSSFRVCFYSFFLSLSLSFSHSSWCLMYTLRQSPSHTELKPQPILLDAQYVCMCMRELFTCVCVFVFVYVCAHVVGGGRDSQGSKSFFLPLSLVCLFFPQLIMSCPPRTDAH